MQTSARPPINITPITTIDVAEITSINIPNITIMSRDITMTTISDQECASAHLIKFK